MGISAAIGVGHSCGDAGVGVATHAAHRAYDLAVQLADELANASSRERCNPARLKPPLEHADTAHQRINQSRTARSTNR